MKDDEFVFFGEDETSLPRRQTLKERFLRAWHGWFWAVEYIPGPVYYIYYCGLFAIVWNEIEGWSWGGWNID